MSNLISGGLCLRKKLKRIVKWRPRLIDFRKNGGTEK